MKEVYTLELSASEWDIVADALLANGTASVGPRLRNYTWLRVLTRMHTQRLDTPSRRRANQASWFGKVYDSDLDEMVPVHLSWHTKEERKRIHAIYERLRKKHGWKWDSSKRRFVKPELDQV